MFQSQTDPVVLIGTTAEMPLPITVVKPGTIYYQTDSGETFISVRVAGVMTWQILSVGGGGSIGDTGVLLRARLASTTNLPLLGLAAIDGVVPTAGDVIGAFGQTIPSQNGLYIASSVAWVRAPNFDSAAEVLPGSLIVVSEGTTLHGLVFQLTTPAPIVVNTTPLTFVPVAGPFGTTAFTGAGAVVIGTSDTLVTFNMAAGNHVATLPLRSSVPDGKKITFVNLAPFTTTIDLTPSGGDTINLDGVFTLTTSTTLINDVAAGTWVRYGIG